MKNTLLLLLTACALLAPAWCRAQTSGGARLKDLVVVDGAAGVQLSGYGLVVGLDRTGDRAQGRRGSPYTVQSIANMLERFGLAVDPAMLSARNTAAVLVTATLPAYTGPGATVDVTVSSLGDARSLSGGVLLQTPLLDPVSGRMFAMAQGPMSTGAVLAATGASSVKINHTNTGRVPGGATVVAMPEVRIGRDSLSLVLKRPDFTNAARIAEAINRVAAGAASAEHAGLVRVRVPAGGAGPAGFIASLDTLGIAVDAPARVVINERTGAIVAGGAVRISEVMVTYGSIVVSTQSDPFVSQPAPLSQGQTVTGAVRTASVSEDAARSVVLGANTDVNSLAAALNTLGLTARDIISILQAIDRAGALQAELVIL